MADIMSLGEVLIDLTQTGTDENGIPRFAAFPGGAPAVYVKRKERYENENLYSGSQRGKTRPRL